MVGTHRRPTILLVDDDHPNRVLLRAHLGSTYDVHEVNDGPSALAFVERTRPDLVLLDVMMPEMTGLEVCKRLKELDDEYLPVILLTALGEQDDRNAGLRAGADDFLTKPVDRHELILRVQTFLRLRDQDQRIRTQLKELNERDQVIRQQVQELGRAYRDLQATQAQLVQSAKVASLGDLVAGLAHEINNPLAFAVSHLATARRSLEKLGRRIRTESSQADLLHWERAEDRLREMTVGLERIQELVLKLRIFSRMDQGEQGLVSMRECVDSVLTILGYRLRGRIEVETRLGEPDQIECFPSLISQALMNLIANAIDAIEGHGRLTISAGVDGDSYSIAVTDTGPGIPEELRERVLEPFFTTKPVGAGTGLGLSITHSIVKKHQGTLELRSAEGGGTTAIIKIPLNPGAPASP
jgi:two-component system, NtrC family, sensor kinase